MAIQANELRLNNWVLRGDVYQQVKSITENSVGLYNVPPLRAENKMMVSINAVNPIPLTPEILTDWCGFEFFKDKIHGNDYINKLVGCIEFDSDKLDNFSIVHIYVNGFHIKSVDNLHLLQNSFFFFTGQELPVNIPGSH